MIAGAQTTQAILKPLRLANVPPGTGTDKVLVRDTAGMVKQVDKRTLIGESIPPTLQGILLSTPACEYGTAMNNKTTFKENGLEFSDSFSSLELTNNSIYFLNKTLNVFTGIAPSYGKTNNTFMLPASTGTGVVLSSGAPSNIIGHLAITTINGIRYLCLGIGSEIVKIKIYNENEIIF
ncbi:hypothetical protein ACUXZJ_07090 [Flavobacterium sp. TN-1]